MDEDVVAAPATSTTKTAFTRKSSDRNLLGKGRYKLWVLAAILLLAVWSMFTGTLTLRCSSSGSLNPFSDDFYSPILDDDLDVLELEEREKVVKHMWDVYTHNRWIRLPKFWQQAFQAAYLDLISDVPGIKEIAISEIAKLSLRSLIEFQVEPPPLPIHFTVDLRSNKNSLKVPRSSKNSLKVQGDDEQQKSDKA